MVRFKPYCAAVQTRFKFRHRESDPWRRLMDATFFQVNWITRTRGASMDQYGGHWAHLITCSHVLMPWMYPNYYPPTGLTKYVSRVSMADCQIQLRLNTLEGLPILKNFASTYQTFHHFNKRLDIATCHTEQFFRRQGELKLLNATTQGMILRPRLEIVEELREGDHVWIYGMKAEDSLLDQERGVELPMVPTGIKGRVTHRTKEVFFVDTSIDELHPNGVEMGMCGGPVMRNGKVVGMLTAKVHEDSPNKDFAGRAMCCYSKDIFEFLLEVEQQMKNAPPVDLQKLHEAPFGAKAQKRMEEEPMYRMHRDFEQDETRVARHVPVPISLWRRDREWVTENEYTEDTMFGRSGVFNQEVQEDELGMDMNASSDIHQQYGAPEDIKLVNEAGDAPQSYGERRDKSGPIGTHLSDEFAAEPKSDRDHLFGKGLMGDLTSFDDKDNPRARDDLHTMMRTMDNIRDTRAAEAMKESVGTHVENRMRAEAGAAGGKPYMQSAADRHGRMNPMDTMSRARERRPHERPNRFEEEAAINDNVETERYRAARKPHKSEVEEIIDSWSGAPSL